MNHPANTRVVTEAALAAAVSAVEFIDLDTDGVPFIETGVPPTVNLDTAVAAYIGAPGGPSQIDAKLATSYIPAWKPSTAYATGAIVMTPDGSIVKRLSSGTSGSTYSSTNWQTVATVSGTQAATELSNVIADQSVSKWEPSSPYVGIRSEAFILRSSSDGDQVSALNAFMADTNIKGKRRLIGYAKTSDVVSVPAGVWVDASQATVEQTGNNKTTFSLGASARLIGATVQGKVTDYAPTVGSSTPQAIGVKLTGDSAHVEDFTAIGIGGGPGASVYGINAPNIRVYGVRVFGVHGMSGITIASGDAGCFGVYFAGCPGMDLEDVRTQDVSIGVQGAYDLVDSRFVGIRTNYIRGQHGVYLQTATGVVVQDVMGHDVTLDLLKMQLSALGSGDSLGGRISQVSGYNIGDTVCKVYRPGADLSTDKKFRGINISGISGNSALRVLYLGSIYGGEFSNISGDTTTNAVVTILDCQDLSGVDIHSRVSGKEVVSFTTAAAAGFTNSATKRVTLRNIKGYNPGNDGVSGNAYGVNIGGTGGQAGGDGENITLDGIEMFADNGFMRSAVILGTGVQQETFRLRNAKVTGYTVAPYALASATRQLGEWLNVDAKVNITNFPTGLPIKIGSIGNRTRWACAALPTSGVYQTGDVVENTTTAAAGSPGWKMTATGGLHGGTWAVSTAYAVGDWRRTSGGKVLECTVAGTSDATTEPAPTVIDSTVTDGTVTWIYRSATLSVAKAMASVAA